MDFCNILNVSLRNCFQSAFIVQDYRKQECKSLRPPWLHAITVSDHVESLTDSLTDTWWGLRDITAALDTYIP